MRHIFCNLKRFDVPKVLGGVNSISPINDWGKYIIENIQLELSKYKNSNVEFTMFFPEAHIIPSIKALSKESILQIGSQSVYAEDTCKGGNFGAFTSNRTGNSMKAMGCTSTIIGHCEERKDKLNIIKECGSNDKDAVDRILNKEIKAAINSGLKVLYCIGESAEDQNNWKEVLKKQLNIGLKGIDLKNIVIAYEPIWAIGPGKTPPDSKYISKIAKYIKEIIGDVDIVYGGGLKKENAEMISNIPEISGGLIALTRFSGDIGFYPEEYLEIVKLYLNK